MGFLEDLLNNGNNNQDLMSQILSGVTGGGNNPAIPAPPMQPTPFPNNVNIFANSNPSLPNSPDISSVMNQIQQNTNPAMNQLPFRPVASLDFAPGQANSAFDQYMQKSRQLELSNYNNYAGMIDDLQNKINGIQKPSLGKKILGAIGAGFAGVTGNSNAGLAFANQMQADKNRYDAQKSHYEDQIQQLKSMQLDENARLNATRQGELANMYNAYANYTNQERQGALSYNDSVNLAKLTNDYDMAKINATQDFQARQQALASQNEKVGKINDLGMALLLKGAAGGNAWDLANKLYNKEKLSPDETKQLDNFANNLSLAQFGKTADGKDINGTMKANPAIMMNEKYITENTNKYGIDQQTLNKLAGGNFKFGFDPKTEDSINKASEQNGLDPTLAKILIGKESSGRMFNNNGQVVTSNKGAAGLMQIMPDTAKEIAAETGLDANKILTDPETNIKAGTYYLAKMIKQNGGDVALGLAAYNAGQKHVDKGDWQKIPETSDYVKTIMGRYNAFQQVELNNAKAQARGLQNPAEMQKNISEYAKSILTSNMDKPLTYMQIGADGKPVAGSGDVPPPTPDKAGQLVTDPVTGKPQTRPYTISEKMIIADNSIKQFFGLNGMDYNVTSKITENDKNSKTDPKPLDSNNMANAQVQLDTMLTQGTPKDQAMKWVNEQKFDNVSQAKLRAYILKYDSRQADKKANEYNSPLDYANPYKSGAQSNPVIRALFGSNPTNLFAPTDQDPNNPNPNYTDMVWNFLGGKPQFLNKF